MRAQQVSGGSDGQTVSTAPPPSLAPAIRPNALDDGIRGILEFLLTLLIPLVCIFLLDPITHLLIAGWPFVTVPLALLYVAGIVAWGIRISRSNRR